MPKLPSLTPQKLIKILEKKGFKLDRVKGSHHIYYNPDSRKRVVVPVHKKRFAQGNTVGNSETSWNTKR